LLLLENRSVQANKSLAERKSSQARKSPVVVEVVRRLGTWRLACETDSSGSRSG
jgi:hypothetical protein